MFSITYRIMRGRIHIHYRKKANRPINQLLRDKKKEVYNVLGYNMQASRPFFHSCCGLNKSFLSVYICSQRWISCSKSQKKENVQKKECVRLHVHSTYSLVHSLLLVINRSILIYMPRSQFVVVSICWFWISFHASSMKYCKVRNLATFPSTPAIIYHACSLNVPNSNLKNIIFYAAWWWGLF